MRTRQLLEFPVQAKRLGRKSLNEIKELLFELGLRLKSS